MVCMGTWKPPCFSCGKVDSTCVCRILADRWSCVFTGSEMDKFPQKQGGVNIQRGFCPVVIRKMIPRGKTLTFWQKPYNLAKGKQFGKAYTPWQKYKFIYG